MFPRPAPGPLNITVAPQRLQPRSWACHLRWLNRTLDPERLAARPQQIRPWTHLAGAHDQALDLLPLGWVEAPIRLALIHDHSLEPHALDALHTICSFSLAWSPAHLLVCGSGGGSTPETWVLDVGFKSEGSWTGSGLLLQGRALQQAQPVMLDLHVSEWRLSTGELPDSLPACIGPAFQPALSAPDDVGVLVRAHHYLKACEIHDSAPRSQAHEWRMGTAVAGQPKSDARQEQQKLTTSSALSSNSMRSDLARGSRSRALGLMTTRGLRNWRWIWRLSRWK